MKPEWIPIYTWAWSSPDPDSLTPLSFIFQLSKEADLDSVLAFVSKHKPRAVIPYASTAASLARTAEMLRGMLSIPLLLPLKIIRRADFRELLGALRRAGFTNFAFPELASFMGEGDFREGEWYHLACGQDPGEINLPGTWSWSRETL